MTPELIGLPPDRSLTRDDLDTMPDDGRRYELLDGLLIASPAPRVIHQIVVRNLAFALHNHCPTDLGTLFAPLDVALASDTVLQPDLIVAPLEDYTEHDLPTAPLLAVEVLSPSTRAYDLLLKKDRLQRAGCPHYWVIDPDTPAIRTWTLTNGIYQDTGTATGDATLTLTQPFPITIRPTDLIRP